MDNLLDLLRREDSDVPLDLAALELSRIEFANLDPQPYYNPRNSCINEVIASRQGIPISLAVVYLSIADRLEMPMAGIGLPGHFLVRYEEEEFQSFVDVYNNGRLLDEEECLALAKQMTGTDFSPVTGILNPVSNRQILVRMLHNLRSIYLRGKSYVKAGQVLDLLLEASPSDADSYILRGAVNVELRKYRAAKSDFERYLQLSPDARDRQRVEDQIAALDRYLMRAGGA
jgi:regulator of sirC expression with transglutaminase-like and TPR domain